MGKMQLSQHRPLLELVRLHSTQDSIQKLHRGYHVRALVPFPCNRSLALTTALIVAST